MSWDYAELSKAAKKAGGPEKLVEILVNSGKVKMIPWLFVAGAVGSALTISEQKIMDYLKSKKEISEAEVKKAKAELIQGINEYDKNHETDNQLDKRQENADTIED